ncbi:NADH-ubiquinone oxidoreductase chain 5-like [Agelaius tricolor]|uniref:NADH-ubiquinone oxidoreductase chain 5-like n=1 Tax=Agelaius tricolor TaxID=9191 RepID=UPI0039F212E1
MVKSTQFLILCQDPALHSPCTILLPSVVFKPFPYCKVLKENAECVKNINSPNEKLIECLGCSLSPVTAWALLLISVYPADGAAALPGHLKGRDAFYFIYFFQLCPFSCTWILRTWEVLSASPLFLSSCSPFCLLAFFPCISSLSSFLLFFPCILPFFFLGFFCFSLCFFPSLSSFLFFSLHFFPFSFLAFFFFLAFLPFLLSSFFFPCTSSLSSFLVFSLALLPFLLSWFFPLQFFPSLSSFFLFFLAVFPFFFLVFVCFFFLAALPFPFSFLPFFFLALLPFLLSCFFFLLFFPSLSSFLFFSLHFFPFSFLAFFPCCSSLPFLLSSFFSLHFFPFFFLALFSSHFFPSLSPFFLFFLAVLPFPFFFPLFFLAFLSPFLLFFSLAVLPFLQNLLQGEIPSLSFLQHIPNFSLREQDSLVAISLEIN